MYVDALTSAVFIYMVQFFYLVSGPRNESQQVAIWDRVCPISVRAVSRASHATTRATVSCLLESKRRIG